MPAMKQTPTLIGLFLCEQVIVEETTRNLTLVNCFVRRTVERFPSEAVPFVVFAVLTDGLGDILLEVVLHRLDTMEEIYRVALPSRFPDPLQEFRCTLRVRGYSFPVPGQYQVTLLGDHEVLAQRKMVLHQKEVSP
jgi:hypothetical protein